MAPEVQGHVSKRAVVGGSDDRAKPLKGEEWNVKLQDRTLGFVITYVDAMSVVSPEEMVASVPERIQAQWKRSPPEWVSEEKWVKFCGLEMKWQAGGLLVGQPSYAASLLEKHPEVRGMQFPFPRGGSEHHGKEGPCSSVGGWGVALVVGKNATRSQLWSVVDGKNGLRSHRGKW